jgi:UMF1 family MFS transporter
MRSEFFDKRIFAWALYDWANSAFACTVLAGFFPILFKEYWNYGVPAIDSTHRLGNLTAFASLVVAIMAPVLGAIADSAGMRKRFLLIFTALGVVMTGALWWVQKGDWIVAAAVFGLAQIGFFGGLSFYDSLIVGVTERAKLDFVSSYGYALGYLGGGLLFAVNVWMVLQPAFFGFDDASHAARFAFLTVAGWWTLFAIPIFLFVPEPGTAERRPFGAAVRSGLHQLKLTLAKVQGLRPVWIFLLAYWFYIDGVDTIIRMAVDYGLSIGFKSADLITALLIVQFVAFPAAVVFGYLGERFGTKRSIFLGLAVYAGITIGATLMDEVREFYAMAAIIGLVQGGVQALSRSYYARLIPAAESGEFFGFYNMLGKFAAILGPALMGWVSLQTGSARQSILSLTLLFAAGGALLLRVQDAPHGAAALSPPPA